MSDATNQVVVKVIAVVDLWHYRDIAYELDRQVASQGVALLNHQIQNFIVEAIQKAGLIPQEVPSKHTGDGGILLFETAEQACEFGEALHKIADRHNHGKDTCAHRRHFRIGIFSGEIVLEPVLTPLGELARYEFSGLAVSDATRLEGACATGEILICPETWAHLPPHLKRAFGKEEQVMGKADERFPAHRCKVVAPALPPEPERTPDSVLDFLGNLLSADPAPRAEGDIDEAIERAIAGVNAVVTKAVAGKRHLLLKDIGDIVGEAIHHGAGIYNSGSHFGCATIYLHAARRTLEYLPDVSSDVYGAPPKGTRLVAEWLAGIVLENPEVEESTADDLAWELRFVFDSIHRVPLMDQVSMVSIMAVTDSGEPDADEICALVRQVIKITQDVRENHVRAYLLRHTAKAVLRLIDVCYGGVPPSRGVVRVLSERLRPVVDANPRITRYNARQLVIDLCATFSGICAVSPGRDGE